MNRRNVSMFILIGVVLLLLPGCGGRSDDTVYIPPDPVWEALYGTWAFWYVDSVEVSSPVIARQPAELAFNIFAPDDPSLSYPFYWSQSLWAQTAGLGGRAGQLISLVIVCGTSNPTQWGLGGEVREPIWPGKQRIVLDSTHDPKFIFEYHGDYKIRYYSAKYRDRPTILTTSLIDLGVSYRSDLGNAYDFTLPPSLVEKEITIHVEPGPVYVDPWEISLSLARGASKTVEFTIFNNKDAELSWRASPNPYSSWITLPIMEGIVPPQSSVRVEATLNPPAYDEISGIPRDQIVGGLEIITSDSLYDSFPVFFEIVFE